VTVLADWHTDFRGHLAGSVYAADPADRVATARALRAAGLDVHVDMMAEAEGLPAGVSLAELAAISAEIGGVDVHLIGSPAFVDDVLDQVLAARPAKVFLPWPAFTDRRTAAIRAAGTQAWIALWQEWCGLDGLPSWPAQPDGVLVMLIEPGTKDHCRLDRLGVVSACAAELPVIVDGGVTADIAPLCVTAGAQSMVVGRALLPGPGPREES
jgi:pentose-5-phosphate-3-epimerase